jgi:hypothetical protein
VLPCGITCQSTRTPCGVPAAAPPFPQVAGYLHVIGRSERRHAREPRGVRSPATSFLRLSPSELHARTVVTLLGGALQGSEGCRTTTVAWQLRHFGVTGNHTGCRPSGIAKWKYVTLGGVGMRAGLGQTERKQHTRTAVPSPHNQLVNTDALRRPLAARAPGASRRLHAR